MNILITGTQGFLGRSLNSKLCELGHQVTGVDIVGEHPVDTRDADALFRLASRIEPDAIVHLAAHSQIGDGAVANVVGDNTAMTYVALSLGRAFEARVVLAGSAAEYGPTPLDGVPFGESAPLLGDEPYAASKVVSSLMAGNFLRAGGDIIVLRFGNLYGPGQRPPKLVASLIETRKARGIARLHGEGKPRRQYLYVDDACHAICLALASEERGFFNISAAPETSSLDLAQMIGVEAIPLPTGGGAMRVAIDSTRARVMLGWESKTELDIGLDATIRHAMRGADLEN